MPLVAVLNNEKKLRPIFSALIDCGLVVANRHDRPSALKLKRVIRRALGQRPPETQLQSHELPLMVGGHPWWTAVFALAPGYEYVHGETAELAARALAASNLAPAPGIFLYFEP